MLVFKYLWFDLCLLLGWINYSSYSTSLDWVGKLILNCGPIKLSHSC